MCNERIVSGSLFYLFINNKVLYSYEIENIRHKTICKEALRAVIKYNYQASRSEQLHGIFCDFMFGFRALLESYEEYLNASDDEKEIEYTKLKPEVIEYFIEEKKFCKNINNICNKKIFDLSTDKN